MSFISFQNMTMCFSIDLRTYSQTYSTIYPEEEDCRAHEKSKERLMKNNIGHAQA